MADLIPLHAEPIGEDVIDTIDKVRAMADAGKVSSVAIAYVTRDGRGGQLWSDLPNVNLIVGSAGRLIHHLNKAADRK